MDCALVHLAIKPTPNQTIGNDTITGLSKDSLKLKQKSVFVRDRDAAIAARVLHYNHTLKDVACGSLGVQYSHYQKSLKTMIHQKTLP